MVREIKDTHPGRKMGCKYTLEGWEVGPAAPEERWCEIDGFLFCARFGARLIWNSLQGTFVGTTLHLQRIHDAEVQGFP